MFKKSDIILIIILFIFSISCFFIFISTENSDGEFLLIQSNGILYEKVPLNENKIIEIEVVEKNTFNIVEVKDGKAKMITSNCKDLLCLNQNHINKSNQTIVCLPNKIVLEVQSNLNDDEIDLYIN